MAEYLNVLEKLEQDKSVKREFSLNIRALFNPIEQNPNGSGLPRHGKSVRPTLAIEPSPQTSVD